ncbi:MAG TPA: hypothetical protein VI321_09565 [Burkholderiales bacterium]
MRATKSSFASRILNSLQRRLGVYVCHVLVRPWSEASAAPERNSGLRYAVLADAQVLAWCSDPELELDRRQAASALRRGDVCIGVTQNRFPIGYVWYAYRTAPHTRKLWVEFQRGLGYAYKAFIRPDHRGRGIGGDLYARGGELCPKKGTHSGISFIAVGNSPSMLAAERAGWRRVGYAGYASFFGAMLPFRSAGAKRFGFCFYAPRGARLPTGPRETRTSAA